MIRVEMRLGGLISLPDGEEIALRRSFALLDGIGRERSVRGAADRMGVSYRCAWGQVGSLQKAVGGGPLVVKTKGHGSVLTEQGAALRDAFGAALGEFEAPLAQAGQRLARTLTSLLAVDARPRRLLLAMSHDPLLLDAIGATAEADLIEAFVVGSAEAVGKLRAGLVDVAGFHSGEDGSRLPGTPALDGLLAGQGFRVEPLFRREQGLLLAQANQLGIASVADLAACRGRFVNRQKGSGTRLWFDRLLAEAGLQPNAIVGYEVEEFTIRQSRPWSPPAPPTQASGCVPPPSGSASCSSRSGGRPTISPAGTLSSAWIPSAVCPRTYRHGRTGCRVTPLPELHTLT